MKKILSSFLLFILLSSCMMVSQQVYTDNQEYHGNIEIINQSNDSLYYSMRSSSEVYGPSYSDTIIDFEIKDNHTDSVDFFWIPGDFTVNTYVDN